MMNVIYFQFFDNRRQKILRKQQIFILHLVAETGNTYILMSDLLYSVLSESYCKRSDLFVFLWQVKRKPKSADKDSGPTFPTVPSITYNSVFDSGRELSSDVYSNVGIGTVHCVRIHANQKMFTF